MTRTKLFFLLLGMAVLLPSVAVAQSFRIFATQKVIVADIKDNNYPPLDDGLKKMIRQSIVDACTASEGYEVFEVNMNDIKRQLKASGKQPTFLNICQMVKRKANADYILFPKVSINKKVVAGVPGIKILIDVEKYRIDPGERVNTVFAEADADQSSVMAAIDRMVGELLGVKVNRQMSQQTYQQPSYQQPYQQQQQTYQQPSYQQPTYSQTPQSYVEDAGCGLNMKMVYVEGGSFRMGATPEQGSDADSDESPVHTVRLDSYYIAECEVTQAQWEKIMGTTIYQQRDKENTQWSMFGVGDNNPMYYVSWEEAQAFCRELSAKTGKTYLLPTEAQWEYAARGGNKSKGYKYSGGYAIDAVAWYYPNSGNSTHAVKQKRANELGLYDMSGNVWEWCSDRFGSYSSSEQINPTGAGSGQRRVLRGGCWYNDAGICRVSYRSGSTPPGRDYSRGFRVACLP